MKIGAIVNLQLPGEHASCGDGTHPSGFSYLPEEFMNNQSTDHQLCWHNFRVVYYYNFGWLDMTVPSLELALSIVQVIAFTETQERKVKFRCYLTLIAADSCSLSRRFRENWTNHCMFFGI
jgi:protein tyrosine phosphatase domain-containing protein 1